LKPAQLDRVRSLTCVQSFDPSAFRAIADDYNFADAVTQSMRSEGADDTDEISPVFIDGLADSGEPSAGKLEPASLARRRALY
jgi:hypothetical protein